MDSFIHHVKNSYILAAPRQIHIEMCYVLQLIFKFFFHAHVFRYDDTHIKFILVKTLRQRTHYICQSACFNKRDTF